MAIEPSPIHAALAWRIDCALGEGPAWFADEGALRFVDIKRGFVHRYDPATGRQESLFVGGKPSFIVPGPKGALLVGSAHGIHELCDDPEHGAIGEALATVPQPLHNRTNDATVDAEGRLWFGTMDDGETQPTGTIWCLADGRLYPTGISAIVTNGPAASSDGWLYHCDSAARRIWRARIDGPVLGQGELFVELAHGEGHPDGIVIDSEDCLWVALWDGWGVRRYAPDGALLLSVALPCARVTKIAFGGPDLRTVFVTTARVGLSGEALAEQPLAGSLFAFDSPVAGRPLPAVRLGA